MTKRLIDLGLMTLLLGLGNAARAADPPKGEVLGMPREIKPYVVPMGSMRTNRYDVWQYYDVDRFGRFRPVVIYSPYGAYYKYNGQPYPWASTQPLDWKLMVIE